MYASNKSSADMSHEQRVLQIMEARKRARAANAEDERRTASAALYEEENMRDPSKFERVETFSSSSSSSGSEGESEK
ncbi:hypothetical protein GUITHDRAFT_116120 [Guillardia theta CCMP2712]|uniref:Uncharacterized protein n=2 Tax=Guillardia theta TaxID=55529 RepID=L1IP37_GUITC|nr:hypothetical protein GUITHDRAFT_116120 [Guillardia theta CCMP2712]EKX37812.1 hypothetical protein GUITHDRAFT_116120 [Guillardia theta CCMP2712]|eukprot:XP_005824792.1 hypothetical protein GUITHDRAFT_116120 [Guillardia theta CCMP2712]